MQTVVSKVNRMPHRSQQRTHLLCNHDNARCLGSPADSRNGEDFVKPGEEVVMSAETCCDLQFLFIVKLSFDIVDVSSRNQSRVAQSDERIEGLLDFVLLEVPIRY